jgi:hypothetical protein
MTVVIGKALKNMKKKMLMHKSIINIIKTSRNTLETLSKYFYFFEEEISPLSIAWEN